MKHEECGVFASLFRLGLLGLVLIWRVISPLTRVLAIFPCRRVHKFSLNHRGNCGGLESPFLSRLVNDEEGRTDKEDAV